jgi:hypothetical protein
MLSRYYSAGLSRFLSVDPGKDIDLEDPQSWNKYSYVRNNPLRRNDPDGRKYVDKTGQNQKNKVEKDKSRSSKEKQAVREADAASQPIKTEVSPDAKIKADLGGGSTVEAQGDSKSVGGLGQKLKESGADVKTVAGESDANVSPGVGTISDAKITIFEGSADIAAGGRSKSDFVTDTFVHESAHVGGDKPRTEAQVEQFLGDD